MTSDHPSDRYLAIFADKAIDIFYADNGFSACIYLSITPRDAGGINNALALLDQPKPPESKVVVYTVCHFPAPGN